MKTDHLVGQQFGRLTVLSRHTPPGAVHIGWLCECVCGQRRVVRGVNLTNGYTVSCGSCATTRVHRTEILPTGVYRRRNNRFTAILSVKGTKIHLGTFDTVRAAAQSYIVAKNKSLEGDIPHDPV